VAVLLLFAGSLGLWWFRERLALAHQFVLWAVFLLLVAVLLRRGWLHLFGPVFVYELLRSARRRRTFVFRVLYAGGLLLLLSWIYLLWLDDNAWRRIPTRALADFAASFFYSLVAVQFVLVALVTPIYTGSAIAEEKDRKTLEFLLATDLRNREIVLGKYAARLASLTLLVLAGLPVLSLLQFLGGVEPGLLLAAFAATGLTMLGLGAWGILNSVLTARARDAIVRTYLGAFGYLLLSGASWVVFLPLTGRAGGPSLADLTDPALMRDFVEGLSAGNPVFVLVRIVSELETGGRLDTILPTLLGNYALFHGLVTVGCTSWAVLRLRTEARKEAAAKPHRLALRKQQRPPIGAQPMLWKEIHAEPGIRWNWLGRLLVGFFVVASFVPAAFMIAESWHRDGWARLGREINEWLRVTGTLVSCLMLLAVAVRAAGAISGERDRQTLDGLLTTPLDSDTILSAKWAGSIWSVRGGWLWLAGIAGIGLVTEGLHPLAVLLLAAAWIVYAAVFALVGLWCSLVCLTTLQATVWTLVAVLALSAGHWLVTGMCCFGPLALLGVRDRDMEWMAFLEVGQTPPAVLGCLAFTQRELLKFFDPRWRNEERQLGIACLVGVACWAGLALFLWGQTASRFRLLAGLSRGGSPRPHSPGNPRR
jgi:ABC-type transport system involved in multi-copper enzyme maturation permease subunit